MAGPLWKNRRSVRVEMPEFGETLILGELSGLDQATLGTIDWKKATLEQQVRFMLRAIEKCALNEDGSRRFEDDGLDASQWSAEAVFRAFTAMNDMVVSQGEAEGNSDAIHNDDSRAA